jgi:hypothetical protein
MAVLGVSERQLFVHLVAVSAAVAALAQIAGLLELADDPRCRSLGDSNRPSDVDETSRGIGRDDLEDVAVVCHEPERMIIVAGT